MALSNPRWRNLQSNIGTPHNIITINSLEHYCHRTISWCIIAANYFKVYIALQFIENFELLLFWCFLDRNRLIKATSTMNWLQVVLLVTASILLPFEGVEAKACHQMRRCRKCCRKLIFPDIIRPCLISCAVTKKWLVWAYVDVRSRLKRNDGARTRFNEAANFATNCTSRVLDEKLKLSTPRTSCYMSY